LQSAGPLQNAGPLQSAGPLQNIAPISAPSGLDIAAPAPGLNFALPPPDVPGLALTPVQLTMLSSGDVTSINQLLGQLVGGNTTSEQLTALVNALVTQPAPTTVPVSLPPVGTPTPSPPVVTGAPPPTATPSPPVVSNPINYVSRS
jgi:hypothetical protein